MFTVSNHASGDGWVRQKELHSEIMVCPLQRRSSTSHAAAVGPPTRRQSSIGPTVTNMNATEWDRLRQALASQLPYKGPLFIRYAFRDATFSSAGAKAGIWFADTSVLNAAEQLDLQLFDSIRSGPPAFAISRADLVSFAGAVAVSNYGGNEIKWRPGRVDAVSAADAGAAFPAPTSSSEDPNILRSFFNNYPGFNDKDIVALMGSHNMGFCHFNKSGFNGPWSLNPYYLTNEYFQRLNNQIQSNGRVYQPITNVTLTPPFHDNTRYVDTSGQNNGQSNGLIMLPADIALTLDGNFKQLVQMFAQNQDQFQLHFQSAFQELLEYGLNLTAPHVTAMLGSSQTASAESVQQVANSNCYPPSGPPIVCVTRRDDTNGNAVFTVFSALKGWVGIGVGTSTMTNGDVIVGYNSGTNAVQTLAFKTSGHSLVTLNPDTVWKTQSLDTSVAAPSWAKISFTASHPIAASANGNPVNGFMTFAASDFLSPNSAIKIVAHDVSGVLSQGQNDAGPFAQTSLASSGLSAGAIAGIAIGAALFGTAIVLLIVFRKRFMSRDKPSDDSGRTAELEMNRDPVVGASAQRPDSIFSASTTPSAASLVNTGTQGNYSTFMASTGGLGSVAGGSRGSFLTTSAPRDSIMSRGTTAVLLPAADPSLPLSPTTQGTGASVVEKASTLFQGLGFWDRVEGYVKGIPALPQDPTTWDGAAAAAWVWNNGGSRGSAEVVLAQDITGETLTGGMISAEELVGLFGIGTVGSRVKFVTALQQLRDIGTMEVPPAYADPPSDISKER